MMAKKQPGTASYLQLLVSGTFLTLTCLLAVYLLAVSIVRVQALTEPEPSGPDRTWATSGDPAPDFALKDTEGREFRLGSQVGKTPVVLQFGSFT
jgi:hypothetical protein